MLAFSNMCPRPDTARGRMPPVAASQHKRQRYGPLQWCSRIAYLSHKCKRSLSQRASHRKASVSQPSSLDIINYCRLRSSKSKSLECESTSFSAAVTLSSPAQRDGAMKCLPA
jgi:hypothetical protein